MTSTPHSLQYSMRVSLNPTVPHLGSGRNVDDAFFKTVSADQYLFSGDSTHGNPDAATVSALVRARPCESFVMNFVNRNSARGALRPHAMPSHGELLYKLFAAEATRKPVYRRTFRGIDEGSVTVNLLDRVTY